MLVFQNNYIILSADYFYLRVLLSKNTKLLSMYF
nr:MAG TPA: hypothetical protein [Caudoviricetes sp.]